MAVLSWDNAWLLCARRQYQEGPEYQESFIFVRFSSLLFIDLFDQILEQNQSNTLNDNYSLAMKHNPFTDWSLISPQVGLTLAQVSCLASCNRLSSEMHHAAETEGEYGRVR